MRYVKPSGLSAAKMNNLVSALLGQDLFAGRTEHLKAPSFGQALTPEGGNTFVGDTHMADIYSVNPAQLFKNTGKVYDAMAAHMRAVAKALGIDTRDAQAAAWSWKVTLDAVMAQNPGATPAELIKLVTPERIAAEKRDFVDIMLRDQQVRDLLRKNYGLSQKQLAEFDQRLKALQQRQRPASSSQTRPAKGAAGRSLKAAIERIRQAEAKRSVAQNPPPPFDTVGESSGSEEVPF
jgi:hypothetical protein